jgi:predicted flap endonuclease-1-like 5' DNA nuclease
MSMDFSNPTAFRREAERAMSLPLGMANPFWLLFGAAATAGMTWWWMSRLSRAADMQATANESAVIYEMAEATASTAPFSVRGRPRKIKIAPSKTDEPAGFTDDPGDAVEQAEAVYGSPESAGYPHVALEPTVPPQARTATHESEIPADSSQTASAAGYPVVAPGPEAMDAADDLTRLGGVGPRIAAALAAHGVRRFADLAEWTSEKLASFDAEMNLRGRARRSDWVEQARRLAAQ